MAQASTTGQEQNILYMFKLYMLNLEIFGGFWVSKHILQDLQNGSASSVNICWISKIKLGLLASAPHRIGRTFFFTHLFCPFYFQCLCYLI